MAVSVPCACYVFGGWCRDSPRFEPVCHQRLQNTFKQAYQHSVQTSRLNPPPPPPPTCGQDQGNHQDSHVVHAACKMSAATIQRRGGRGVVLGVCAVTSCCAATRPPRPAAPALASLMFILAVPPHPVGFRGVEPGPTAAGAVTAIANYFSRQNNRKPSRKRKVSARGSGRDSSARTRGSAHFAILSFTLVFLAVSLPGGYLEILLHFF